MLTSLGENLSDKELKDMMDEADIDGNGGVDFDGTIFHHSFLINLSFVLSNLQVF